MDAQVEEILAESVILEKKVGDLYRLHARLFPEDEGFWHQLAEEEDYHSVIMHSAKDCLFNEGLFPSEALDPDSENIRRMIRKIDDTIAEYKRNPPAKADALRIALELERDSGEYYLKVALDLPYSSTPLDLLRQLVGENRNHAERIQKQMRISGI
jgi:rubrerythrin